MGSLLPVIIQLISGAIGGNAAGSMMKDKSLGTLGNSIAGIVGGGIGGQILGMLGVGAATGGGTDIGSIIGSLLGGGVGGGILMVIIGFIKKAFAKSST